MTEGQAAQDQAQNQTQDDGSGRASDQASGRATGNATGRAEDEFAFLLGFVRSGTTMLRAMLDSHSAVAVPPESYFLVGLLQSQARLETPAGLDWPAVLERVKSDRYFHDWNLEPEALAALRDDDRIRTTADA